MAKKNNSIFADVMAELQRAKRLHPSWPDHIVARAAIVTEEAGELIRASLQFKYEPAEGDIDRKVQYEAMRREAVQTAAMALRFIENLDRERYDYSRD